MQITLAHSPDPDDAFMHHAIARQRIATGPYRFEVVADDIDSLNFAARVGRYQITAVSIHAFAYVHDRYALLNHGGSMGEGYGPVVVAKEEMSLEDLAGVRVAIPGIWTTAALVLRLAQPKARFQVLPFQRVLTAVAAGRVEAGVIIHEGQLTYSRSGVVPVADLGEWWRERSDGLPLPLGGNTVRRDVGKHMPAISGILRRSIEHAREHREEALTYAADFGRGIDVEEAGKFIDMYVNERTLDYGDDGRRAIRLLFDRGAEAGLIPAVPELDFVE